MSPIGGEPGHVALHVYRGKYFDRGRHTPCEFCPTELVVGAPQVIDVNQYQFKQSLVIQTFGPKAHCQPRKASAKRDCFSSYAKAKTLFLNVNP